MTREELDELINNEIELIHTNNYEQLSQIKTILNNIFGEEYNQIKPNKDIVKLISSYLSDAFLFESNHQFIKPRIQDLLNKASCYLYEIILYFPDITLTNSNNKQHSIKDIYVIIELRWDFKTNTELYGLRTTLKHIEAFCGYKHSHLSSNNVDKSRFCLGKGPLGQILALLNTEFDIDSFTLLLHSIRPYLQWESIEGNPYMYLERITYSTKVNTGYTNLSEYRVVDLYKMFLKSDLFIDNVSSLITVNIESEAKVELKDDFDIAFATYIISLINTLDNDKLYGIFGNIYTINNRHELILCKNTNGSYFYPTSQREISNQYSHAANCENILINFKNSDKTLTILPYEGEVLTTENIFYVHPSISEQTRRFIEESLNDYLFSGNTSYWDERNSNSIEEVTEPDQISLSESI